MTVSETTPVLLEWPSDTVARIRFNRPEKRNAMNLAARTGLVDSLNQARGEAKVVILTGSGTAFCAGVDLKEAAARQQEPIDDTLRATDWRNVQEVIREHPAIVIAAVNGLALGGGMTLVNVADLAIASDRAQFGMPEAGFGVYPGLAGPSTQLRIAPKRAAWLVLTTKRIDAATAERWGVVNEVVPHDDLDQAAEALGKHVAQFDPVALELSKRALWEIPMRTSEWTAAMRFAEDVNADIRSRSDATAGGLGAFAAGERRPGQGI